MSYMRPEGLAVDLQFSGVEYARPQGNEASFGHGAVQLVITVGVGLSEVGAPLLRKQYERIDPAGAELLAVGWPAVRDPTRYARPYGLAAHFTTTGLPYTRPDGLSADFGPKSLTLTIYPAGHDAHSFGTPEAWNHSKRVAVGAIPPTNGYGSPNVWLYTRYLKPSGVQAASYGNAWASHWLRYITAAGVGDKTARGTPWISHSPRELAPAGFDAMKVLESHLVGGTRVIEPVGTEMTQWGERIIPEGQTLYPQGFVGEVGTPDVQLHTRYLGAKSFETTPDDLRFPFHYVWNLRQYIRQDYDPSDGLSPQPFGQWTAIENRNRVIHTHSTAPGSLPSPTIENGARAIIPSGIAAPETGEFYKAGLVAYRIRYFPIEGISPPLLSRWAAVHNDARLISPRGISCQAFGSSTLTKTRRYFDRIGAFDSAVAGYPMVSFKVREITFESRYGIAPPSIKLPEVKLHVRYLDGIGFEASRMGWPALSIHWNKMTPRWTARDFFGEPGVRNVTPEVATYGRCAEEFGVSAIRTQWREIVTLENYPSAVGTPKIADRKQRVSVTGLSAVRVSDHLKVSKLTEDLPVAQTILPGGVVLINAFGFPALNQQVVFVPSNNLFSLFGLPVVTANSIRVEPGVGVQLLPEPTVSLKNREIKVSAFSSEFVYEPNPVRVSPHTIYAMTEATEQAITNHRPGGLHWIDHDPSGYRVHGGVGSPTLTLRHRRLFAQGHDDEGVGVPEIGLHRRYVAVPSIKSFRSGYHEVWGGVDELLVEGTPSDAVVSAPTVSRPPYVGPQTLFVRGLEGWIGDARVELFNRTLNLSGFDSLAMGATSGSDAPYAWQSLHVGEPMPTLPDGRDMSVFGDTWISSRVRGIEPDGEDFFVCDYDFLDFSKRMRVSLSARPRPATQTARAKGFCSFVSPAINARPGASYIRPDGNADMFRKGAF